MVMPRVERAFRPGQAARGRLTITNDGNVPTRYAVEVSPGVTAPFVGFVAEETAALVTDVVQPGRSATVRIPLSLPQDITEGRKVVRVRIGEVGPDGELAEVLDEQFFSGLLRVEVPRPAPVPAPPTPVPVPPAPPPAPERPPTEAMPLPGEVPRVQGRIVSVESPQRGQEMRGGQRVMVRVTYWNTGSEPHAFSAIAWAGEILGQGQIDPDVQGTARGPMVGPGSRSTLEVPLELPQEPALGFGPKDVLVMLVDLDPMGRFPVVIYDSRGLPSLFSLSAPPVPALPTPPPPTPPQVPAPVTPRGLVPGDLDLLDPIATPGVARPGQTVQLDLPFMNAGPVSPPVTASVFILGPQGTAIADLPQLTFSPDAGMATLRTVRWTVPQAAAPGSYGVQVFAWDPNTFVAGDPSTYLIREQVLDVFTVEAIPVEVAPPEVAQPPVEMAPPGPRVPSPGDLGQPSVQFSPSTVEMGQVTQGSVAIPNLADFSFTARVTMSLIDSAGQGVQTVVLPTDLAFNPLESRSAGFALNTAGLEPGTYGVRVVAVDAFTGTTLMDQNIPGGLQVTIPAALRGVNEFSNLRWFYGAEEPPAPLPTLPITRRAGDPTGGFVLLRHRGEGGRFNIGYGTAAAQVFGHGDPFRFYIAQEEIPPHLVATDMIVRIPQGPWPSVALAGPGRYDALKFIDNADTRESVHQNWDEDVFQVPG